MADLGAVAYLLDADKFSNYCQIIEYGSTAVQRVFYWTGTSWEPTPAFAQVGGVWVPVTEE